MTGRAAFEELHSGTFYLDKDDVPAIQRYLSAPGWLQPEESVCAADPAGEGNMNYTLRIHTTQRSFVLKQARPWVEKYSHIAAPWDRALVEGGFYRQIESNRALARKMPSLLGFDPEARVLMLEDAGAAPDFTSIYSERNIRAADLRELLDYLIALHLAFRDPNIAARFRNMEMRGLNHEHIFALPLRARNGIELDAMTPGLTKAAEELQNDLVYKEQVAALGRLYLGDGQCLIHGDYFPGSWLRTKTGVRVIDPEFSFFGLPEFDIGVMTAHLHLARVEPGLIDLVRTVYAKAAPLDATLLDRFAGVEIMRRLIGVAQLSLPYGLDEKRRLLQLARKRVTGR